MAGETRQDTQECVADVCSPYLQMASSSSLPMVCSNRLLTPGDMEDSVCALFLATVGCARFRVPRREWLAVVVERAEARCAGTHKAAVSIAAF